MQGKSIPDTMRYVPVHKRHFTQKPMVLETVYFGFYGQRRRRTYEPWERALIVTSRVQ